MSPSIAITSLKMQQVFIVGALVCASCGCSGTGRSGEVHQGPDEVAPAEPATESLQGWAAETFELPPGFAPELPTGVESLRFAPGWRDPKAEGFWSYAFVMWIDEPAPDEARLGEILQKYYTGLMKAFAEGAGRQIDAESVQVEVLRLSAGRYEASMRLIDAFATFEPIRLRILIDTSEAEDGDGMVRIRISPQPEDHMIWSALEAASREIAGAGPGEK